MSCEVTINGHTYRGQKSIQFYNNAVYIDGKLHETYPKSEILTPDPSVYDSEVEDSDDLDDESYYPPPPEYQQSAFDRAAIILIMAALVIFAMLFLIFMVTR